MNKKKCIGCDEPSSHGLCESCESKLNTLEAALAKAGQKLELVKVSVK